MKKTDPHWLLTFDAAELDRLDKESITDDDRGVYSTLLLRPEHKEFPKEWPKADHITQGEFARLVGMDEAQVSRLVARRVLTPALPWRLWVLQLGSYRKGLAAGRRGASGY
jgi:hypothetical protein